MHLNNRPKQNTFVFAVGALVGASAAFLLPHEWLDLSYTPWFTAWIVGPSFIVYAALCIATFTDFISNDGTDPHRLFALWVFSVGLVMGGYGLVLSIPARRVLRFRKKRTPSRANLRRE